MPAFRRARFSNRCRCGWAARPNKPSNAPHVLARAGRRDRVRRRGGTGHCGIKKRLAELGRSIDEDHYGAGFGFRFGSPDEPICQRYIELLTKRLGREPKGFLAAGDATDIMALLHEFRAAGVHKFILRPVASGAEDFIDQTRQFVEKLMPEVAALNS